MQGTPRSELAVELDRCARVCEETAQLYAERDGKQTNLVSSLLLAAAALDTAGRAVEGEDADTALLIAATLACDAAAAAEGLGVDGQLLDCLLSLRRVAASCERALDEP